ncbi:bifunctional phosphoribosylaminoimidazolecarboxamide formyltransferase/IMP cyclohydrolase [Rubellimicrobium roseum]|uniref:Bifunctional purine biosynthesis protein PurH n=1 Tax=Rubellimicrobium roseum TaxID=687525 RepID=A0A5C4NG83_9RHOB|nr:bifunctional phosphoribosylaminoimidazolecarboxamide formyltransferase/IMP cyclohydrolase [Rubellimicrobium roseum]TNC72398.1 bifunctional phosphoribosylaminoimidazolecarboxamide formyltransferase/IMP cyclohydrolase [Rubellimicrobium roseum]
MSLHDSEDLRPVRRALLSVSDKAGLLDLARRLAALGVALVSTGASAGMLREAGLAVTEVAEVTGSPEMLGGRVKTLHPRIHGGILGKRGDAGHVAEMATHGIAPIDLVAVNLYPFEATVARGASFAETVEQIDVGGPAMIRAAAKNHADVAVLTDPADYPALLAELEATGGTTGAFRRGLARKAFARTAEYDAAISGWLARDEEAPAFRALTGRIAQTLRYGENPHQRAAFYRTAETRPGVATASQVQGKELSYNNIADTDAAYELVAEFDAAEGAAVVIVKHANPCGVALGATLAEAHARALACDPVSAFGGIVAVNRPLDRAAAEAIVEVFTEVVIAPDADEEAKAIFARKGNLRLLLAGGLPDARAPGLAWKQVAGGLLVQDRDAGAVTAADLRIVTRRAPSETELADLLFAWRVAKHVKSNAIVLAQGGATVGVGAGQMSRVDSARTAARKMSEMAQPPGAPVLASDAFFPFADGLQAAAEAGATAVIQPGGSMRDAEVIAAADAAGLAMVFTGLRHFRH